MGHRCCSKQKVKRGLWSPEEDEKLVRYITAHGHGSWSSVPKLAGLQRCGKSCRLRWINYLRPELKRGSFSAQEEQIIIDVHRILGNRWAQIAKHLPGRTDNEVKNFWNSCIKKKLISQGLDPKTHNLISSHQRNSTSHNNKVVVCSSTTLLPQPHHQQPFSVFTVNQQQQQTILTDHHHIDIASMDELNPLLPPFLALPPLPPPQQPQRQNPNPPAWSSSTTARDQHISFPCGSSFSSPSPSSLNPNNPLAGFGFSDENSFWNAHQGPRPEQILLQTHENNSIISEMGNVDIIINGDHHQHHEHKCGGSQDIDHVSFDSASFDLELVESALLSGAICRDLTSMDDLAWNF